jgi:glycine oxidase
MGVARTIRPIRGQIVLLAAPPLLSKTIQEGTRYLVPRSDGRILVGSTEEDVGFDNRVTADGVRELIAFALSLVPELNSADVERTWAGLRPATLDRLPYLGKLPGLDNAFVAAGHFRSGLQQSCGTAHLMGQLMRGETPDMDLAPFAVEHR